VRLKQGSVALQKEARAGRDMRREGVAGERQRGGREDARLRERQYG
jgi:hypothetical protein